MILQGMRAFQRLKEALVLAPRLEGMSTDRPVMIITLVLTLLPWMGGNPLKIFRLHNHLDMTIPVHRQGQERIDSLMGPPTVIVNAFGKR